MWDRCEDTVMEVYSPIPPLDKHLMVTKWNYLTLHVYLEPQRQSFPMSWLVTKYFLCETIYCDHILDVIYQVILNQSTSLLGLQYFVFLFSCCYYSEDQALFNYRLSRAWRIIENSFGILVLRYGLTRHIMCSCTCSICSIVLNHRCRLFRQPIKANPKSVVAYTKAAVALHNFLRCTESTVYCPAGYH